MTVNSKHPSPNPSEIESVNPRRKTPAEQLASMGFSLFQLLQFYMEHKKAGKLKQGMTTSDVVRDIIIPDTAERTCCYMEGDFMKNYGGPKFPLKPGSEFPLKFVSHSWESPFELLVRNIVIDATGWDASKVSLPLIGMWYNKLTDKQLHRITYWLCIFAVNQHRAICGDCLVCNSSKKWTADEYKKPICQCDDPKPKNYPCICGSQKTPPGDEEYEMDLFPVVMEGMDEQVVSLDPMLETLGRVWVVGELGQALSVSKVIHFRMAEPLHRDRVVRLRGEERLFPLVQDCSSTKTVDKEHILAKIRETDLKYTNFNNFVQTVVNISFGRLESLDKVTSNDLKSFKELVVQCSYLWRNEQHPCSMGFDRKHLSKLIHLQSLSLSFQGCNLQTLRGLEELSVLPSLKKLVLNFAFCEELVDISSLGPGLGALKELEHLHLNFRGRNQLVDISALGPGLGALKKLRHLQLNFAYCLELVDISALGPGFGALKELEHLQLNFKGCWPLVDISALGPGLGALKELKYLQLEFNGCKQLVDISALGPGLGALKELEHLYLFFSSCIKLPGEMQQDFYDKQQFLDAWMEASPLNQALVRQEQWQAIILNQAPSEAQFLPSKEASLNSQDFPLNGQVLRTIADGIAQFKQLVVLDLNLAALTYLLDLDGFGRGIRSLVLLQILELDLSGCRRLESLASLEEGIGSLSALTTLSLRLVDCTSLGSLDLLGPSFHALDKLDSLLLDVSGCENLSSINGLAKGIGALLSLQKLTVNTEDCAELSKTDAADLLAGIGMLTQLNHFWLIPPPSIAAEAVIQLSHDLPRELSSFYLNLEGCKIRLSRSLRKDFTQDLDGFKVAVRQVEDKGTL